MGKVLHFCRKAEPEGFKEFVNEFEYTFNIEVSEDLNAHEMEVLRYLLSETFEPWNFSDRSFLKGNVIEVGPRMNFETSYSTNAVSIFHACGVKKVKRIERSRRYLLKEDAHEVIKFLYDRMTECPYPEPLKSFETEIKPKGVRRIPLLEKGKRALEEINRELGLGMDRWDIDYYYDLFVNFFKRNPTDAECFHLAQANSEHSRHWFFKGKLVIDGKEVGTSLLEIIKKPYLSNPSNSLIAFKDNSSAIKGGLVKSIIPYSPGKPSSFKEIERTYHPVFTAETHNFPTGVAPFPGAETGTGGRIRDVQAVGRGGIVIAGTTGYAVGNLLIPNYRLPWERKFKYPKNLASPLEIEIQASNGASDYGNKFGEPVIQGWTRSFGLKLPNGERREWIKPIMFTGGVGQIDDLHIQKISPEEGMLVVMIGGPAYRIGIGGGSASSMIAGAQSEELDFNAVQRGDAEMEQKIQRVIRACIEIGEKNPILSIHDQGAGGPCNVLTELLYPAGGKINLKKIRLGDQTLSPLEIWGAEYQERNALLIYQDRIDEFIRICEREKCPYELLGEITGDGRIVVYDEDRKENVVEFDLEKILGKMPRKTFEFRRKRDKFFPLKLPQKITVRRCLERVLRLLSVGSKRFLTTKVDRSVTGLVARQQCCGPLQLTVSDVAVVAQGYLSKCGIAISIGEAPIKMLIDPGKGAEMAVGEALTNLLWARITKIEDVKCSANWMWAAKFEGEGPKIYDAAMAMTSLMMKIGIAVDGGKDSISMAAKVGRKVVKTPGSLVISAYAPVPDITKVLTPDLKEPGGSLLFFLDLACGNMMLGGSALAQVFGQIGKHCPGVHSPDLLKRGFNAVQELIDEGILSGHDRSDGGLITTLLEMAFSGNCGFEIEISKICKKGYEIPFLFNEELGLVIEVPFEKERMVREVIKSYGLSKWFSLLGRTKKEKIVKIRNGKREVLAEDMRVLRDIWEETSSKLDELQADREVVLEERKNNFDRKGLSFHLTFSPEETPEVFIKMDRKPKVAVIREEGTNGDREMACAFFIAGFEVWDITMTDIIEGRVNLSDFRGVIFPGGFSYGDVLDAGKGWAGEITFNDKLKKSFKEFYERRDTFSFGVCNGCQLMSLLGWVPWSGISIEKMPRFIKNRSKRFESRFVSVKILKSPSIMLKGMEESVIGVWVAHGEGRFYSADEKILGEILKNDLVPIRFVDDDGFITEKYPFNPNGSPYGITGLCSPDGRHLAMMPHPERCVFLWQFPYLPKEMRNLKASPWLKIFQNAMEWCSRT